MSNDVERNEQLLRLKQIYYQLFSSPQGQEVMDDLRRRFFYRLSYTPNDPYHTAFREGQRDAISFITNMMRGGQDDR